MANVVPSFGFGFAVGQVNNGWQSQTASHPGALQQVSNIPSPSPTKLKRRLEQDDESDNYRHNHGRDASMDRSPPPERPKKAPPKRARVVATAQGQSKEATSHSEHHDVDVGVLLARLPPESLLPILTALVKEQPSLKESILPLIPRPTLDSAVEALITSSKQLRDAYPYSTSSGSTSSSYVSGSAQSPGLGFGFGQPAPGGSVARVAGSLPASIRSSSSPQPEGSGMRDTYVQSRLRPHIEKFIAACTAYLPYYSNSSAQFGLHNSSASAFQPHLSASSLNETFTFLSTLTQQILLQPPLTQSSLVPLLLPRLSDEWQAWVRRVDEHVNRQAGMFGTDAATGWSRRLDEFCGARSTVEFLTMMRSVRRKWIASVGWLVGRHLSPEPMDV